MRRAKRCDDRWPWDRVGGRAPRDSRRRRRFQRSTPALAYRFPSDREAHPSRGALCTAGIAAVARACRTACPCAGQRICKASRRGNRSRARSEEHTSELQSQFHLVCRLLLEKKKKKNKTPTSAQKKKTNHINQ